MPGRCWTVPCEDRICIGNLSGESEAAQVGCFLIRESLECIRQELFQIVFSLPARATHLSGLGFYPDRRHFARPPMGRGSFGARGAERSGVCPGRGKQILGGCSGVQRAPNFLRGLLQPLLCATRIFAGKAGGPCSSKDGSRRALVCRGAPGRVDILSRPRRWRRTCVEHAGLRDPHQAPPQASSAPETSLADSAAVSVASPTL